MTFRRPNYQTEVVALKPRLVEGAVSSYNFLNKSFVKFPGIDCSVMVLDGPEMKSSLEYVGEISLDFCNRNFKEKVFQKLKENKVIDVRVDPEAIGFGHLADFCQKRLRTKDSMFQRYQVKNMADTSFFYGAYGGMLP
jgi:hypothetical protein